LVLACQLQAHALTATLGILAKRCASCRVHLFVMTTSTSPERGKKRVCKTQLAPSSPKKLKLDAGNLKALLRSVDLIKLGELVRFSEKDDLEEEDVTDFIKQSLIDPLVRFALCFGGLPV
jgi:hypothetical protein